MTPPAAESLSLAGSLHCAPTVRATKESSPLHLASRPKISVSAQQASDSEVRMALLLAPAPLLQIQSTLRLPRRWPAYLRLHCQTHPSATLLPQTTCPRAALATVLSLSSIPRKRLAQ